MLVHFVAADYHGDHPFGFISNNRRLYVATTLAQEYQFRFGNMTYWQEQRATAKKAKNELMYVLVDYCLEKEEVFEWEDVRLPPGVGITSALVQRGRLRVDEPEER